MAELGSLHRSYIGAIERSQHNIGLDNIERIASTLGVEIHDLLGDESLSNEPNHRISNLSSIIVHKQILIELLNQSKDQNYELALVYLSHSGLIFKDQ